MRTVVATLALCAGVGCADGAADDDAGAFAPERDDARYFATAVVSLTVGEGGGLNADVADVVVIGPPQGSGQTSGSLDVVSLGLAGVIVLRLGVDVVDRDGPDFIVFENAFKSGPRVFTEPGEVAISDDGENFFVFPCVPADASPNGCAGYSPVLAHPENDVDPRDPAVAGGDAFDLASVGLARARYVRVVDRSAVAGDVSLSTGGFDIDAVAVIHADDAQD